MYTTYINVGGALQAKGRQHVPLGANTIFFFYINVDSTLM